MIFSGRTWTLRASAGHEASIGFLSTSCRVGRDPNSRYYGREPGSNSQQHHRRTRAVYYLQPPVRQSDFYSEHFWLTLCTVHAFIMLTFAHYSVLACTAFSACKPGGHGNIPFILHSTRSTRYFLLFHILFFALCDLDVSPNLNSSFARWAPIGVEVRSCRSVQGHQTVGISTLRCCNESSTCSS